jgi:HK97 family phage major capsid protein
MGKRRNAAAIAAELELLRTELVGLDELEEPTDDQVTRAGAALGEWETLTAEHTDALAYEEKLALVRSASIDPGNREAGVGDKPGGKPGGKGPDLVVRTNRDPYEGLDIVRVGGISRADVIARAKQAVEDAPDHMNDQAREHVTQLLQLDNKHAPLIARHALLTGSDEYHQQFEEYMASGFAGPLLRASMTLTDANGGYLVPFTLDPTIILTNAGIADPIRSISTVKTIATDTWNGVSSAGVSAEWRAEGTAAADASPTFAQPTITPKGADIWVEGTYEVLADSGFASELGMLLADGKARHEGAAFATANVGATRPRGVVAAVAAVTASLISCTTTTGTFTVTDVFRVADALRPRDASEASWLANKAIYNKIRQFDTTGSAAFWANLGMGRPKELIGQPQYEASTMAAAVANAALVLLCGDFKKYYIVDRVGMSVLYEPMVKDQATGRPNGKAGWFAFWRVGADVVDADAFRLLQLNVVPAAVALA